MDLIVLKTKYYPDPKKIAQKYGIDEEDSLYPAQNCSISNSYIKVSSKNQISYLSIIPNRRKTIYINSMFYPYNEAGFSCRIFSFFLL
jgi:TnpA family transposase